MAKGRYGRSKQKKGGGVGDNATATPLVSLSMTTTRQEPTFVRADDTLSNARFASPYLLTLVFSGKAEQHRALARIEAFYESTSSDTERRFLTLQQASQQRLCPNYEAFNCPMAVVREWLTCMQRTHGISQEKSMSETACLNVGDATGSWWEPFCNAEEAELLDYLASLGCLADSDDDASSSTGNVPPRYMITAIASQASSSLQHERLHFLYFASSAYRALAQREFAALPAKARKVIESDLHMRGYAKHVYVDEFQAYVSLNSAEFGKNVRDECASVQPILLRAQRDIWVSLRMEDAHIDDANTMIS